MRIAIVNSKKCKPKECGQECKKECPVVKLGKLCIVVTKKDKTAQISEELCNGCNICTKKCPFEAISIINLPRELNETETVHRYGKNTFKLFRFPTPRLGQVLGLVGSNGLGKSTILKILAGKITPNLGDFSSPGEWNRVLSFFKGSELQNYFTLLLEGKIKASIKPQYVDAIPKFMKNNEGVRDLLNRINEKNNMEEILNLLDLKILYNENRDINVLSGGELQRFAIAHVCLQNSQVSVFDEPSSFLDIKQRINAALSIRSILSPEKYVICVEHDLSILDYLSDFICVLHGTSGAYGVVTLPYSVREGINIFLEGFIPTENLRFRESSLSFKISTPEDEEFLDNKKNSIPYPEMIKNIGNFQLKIEKGDFTTSQITVLLGQNGCGKSTYLNMFLKNEMGNDKKITVSLKPQKLDPKFDGTVRDLLNQKINSSFFNVQFQSDVLRPLNIENLLDLNVKNLSGGELQRVAITLCLGKNADLYLIDEPSAYLDSEQRMIIAKMIKRFIMHSKKSAFIVEHDFIMATYLADRVIYYDGIPSLDCVAHTPESLLSGMNKFLKQIDITLRKDSTNFRPRINKRGSVKDTEQKCSGNYFFID